MATRAVAPPVVELGRLAAGRRCRCRSATRAGRRRPLRERLAPPCPGRDRRDGSRHRCRRPPPRAASSCATATWSPSREVDLELRAGEVVALMGRNGSGKSSLLWALQGPGRGSAARSTSPAATRRRSRRSEPGALGRAGAADAGDLLYLTTVGEECAQADRRAGAPRRARAARCSIGLRRTSTPTSTRATCPRASGCLALAVAARGARRRSCCSTSRPAASTTRPRPASPACCASSPRERPRRRRRDPRRRVRRRRRPTGSSCSPTARSWPTARPPRSSSPRRCSPRRWPRSSRRSRGSPSTEVARRPRLEVACDATDRDAPVRPIGRPRMRAARPRSASVLALASSPGWPVPLAAAARRRPSGTGHARDAPFLFVAAAAAARRGRARPSSPTGGLDAKAVALLGVLAAVGAALRPLGAGHRRLRAGVLPARPGRPGLRARLRLRARLARRCSRPRCSPAGSGRGCRSRCSAPPGSGSARAPPARVPGPGRDRRCSPPTARSRPAWPTACCSTCGSGRSRIGAGTELSFVPGDAVVENLHRFLVFT